jgi:hypothetical protein
MSLLHFLDSRLTDDGEIDSLTRRPPFTPQEDSWYSFLLEAESNPGLDPLKNPMALSGIESLPSGL